MAHTEPQVRWMVPLGRKIGAVIFLCIFAAEAVLLSFSYVEQHDRLITQVDRYVEVLLPSLSAIELNDRAVSNIGRISSGTRYPVVGVIYERAQAESFQSGNVSGIRDMLGSSQKVLHENGNAYYYDHYVQLTRASSNQTSDLFLRFDVSAVREELKLYIFNTFFLTLFVTLIVIAGCLIALRPFLFNPITTLGSLMRRVDRTGLAAVYIPNRMLLKRDEIGDTFRAFSRMRDALLKADEENQQITARFQGMADLAADCFFETDENRRFSFVAGDTFSVFGLRPSKMVGKTFADLVAQGRLPFAKPQEVVASLQEKGTWEGQLVSSDRHVEGRTVKMISTPLFDRDGNRVGMRGVLTDTTLAAKLTRELVHRAAHDGLTGLYNRTEFSRRLVGCLEQIRVDQGKACVFVMDLDRFKYVNDRCGHLAGDEVLRRVSEILRSSVRASDAVARMGGDEFAILLERCNSQNGLRVAEKIREAIDRMRFEWDGVVHSVGVSIGIVEVDETYTDVDAVILAADSSCFVSKRQGRNQVSVYSPSDDTVKERSEDMQWINLIERALKEDRCILFQQPIMPLKQAGTKKVHFEVLLRLLDESGEIVPPGAFLPCAERNGLIDGIDRQVVRKVLKWLAVQKAEPSTDLTVSMNLSGASIADANFQEFLLTSISEAPVSAHHLCFEITESAAVQNLVSSGEFLSRVRALGCRIALDDFGTGFASLEYIKQLPLDFIKIDGAFIREIANNPLDQALVRCVSDVAHLLDVETVAEFVENDETIHELNRLGIDFAQGFLIAKPKPLGDLSTLFPAAQADLTE